MFTKKDRRIANQTVMIKNRDKLIKGQEEKIAKLVNDNLLQIEKGYVKVTKSNLYILDYIERILLY